MPIKPIFKNRLFKFVLTSFLLFIVWFIVYDFMLQPNGYIDQLVIDLIIQNCNWLLNLIGFSTIPADVFGSSIRTVGIDGSHGVWVGNSCNGLALFALFSGFVIAFPGPIKSKLWFLPLGVILIHFLNIIRVSALAVIQHYNPAYLEFNHTYTFTILVYSFVFFLWYIWSNKLSHEKT